MTTTGPSDPERTIDLLWHGQHRTSGTDLNLRQIVSAAIEVADADGLTGLSMRKVAERLGYTTMALYRHVPGRDHLIDLAQDAAHGPPPDLPPGGWRTRLEAAARQGWELRERHPWLAEIRGTRHPPGPNIVAHYERMLATLADTGLSASEVVATAELVGRFVDAEASRLAEAAAVERASGQSEQEWWGARDSLYAELGRYPTLQALWEAGGFAPGTDSFEFGLARLLDGIEQLIRSRDKLRDETTRCPVCDAIVPQPGAGRRRTYCSRACQQRSYRNRQS